MENKSNWKTWLTIVLILAWLIFSVYMFVYFKTECKLVKENPFIYAAKEANAEYCVCTIPGKPSLEFNQEKAWQIVKGKPEDQIQINISKINNN